MTSQKLRDWVDYIDAQKKQKPNNFKESYLGEFVEEEGQQNKEQK